MTTNALMIYMTCENQEEAQKIAAGLLEQNLIACANILPQHTAVYRWEGRVETDAETAMLLKTQEKHFEAVRAAICDLHSYDCPCIVSWPVEKGHQPFLDWIAEETGR